MVAIIDGIASLKQSRRPDEKSTTVEADDEYFVLGGDHLGASIARGLHADGLAVSVVDETHDPAEMPGVTGNPGDPRVLEEAGVSGASTVIVATPRDSRNLLIAQLVRVHFDDPDILVLVNVPDRYEPVAAAGYEPICATTALSDVVLDSLANAEREPDQTA